MGRMRHALVKFSADIHLVEEVAATLEVRISDPTEPSRPDAGRGGGRASRVHDRDRRAAVQGRTGRAPSLAGAAARLQRDDRSPRHAAREAREAIYDAAPDARDATEIGRRNGEVP